MVRLDGTEVECIADFDICHGTLEILLVGKDEERCTCKPVFQQETMKFFLAVFHAHSISRINDPHERICLLEVVPPIRAKGALSAHIPYIESVACANVLILNPNVGLTLRMSSPLSFLRIVVLPALSSPLRCA